MGHEEPEEDEDEILKGEGEPVDISPGSIICDDARKKAGCKHTEEKAGCYDRNGGSAAVRRSKVADQRDHYVIDLSKGQRGRDRILTYSTEASQS